MIKGDISDVVVARLGIDSRRRIYVPKQASFLRLFDADEILLTMNEHTSDCFRLVLVKEGRIFKVWKMVPE